LSIVVVPSHDRAITADGQSFNAPRRFLIQKTFPVGALDGEAAVREAAKRNNRPVDSVTEIPVILYPK
jgi:hypothetical protein